VQRLQESGVIQIVAVTDPLQLGFRRQAMVGIQADGDLSAVADALAELPEVDYVVITPVASTCWPRPSARTSTCCGWSAPGSGPCPESAARTPSST
jgi:hypothetical protein